MQHNRRKFIQTTAAGSAAMLLQSLQTFASPATHLDPPAKGYGLKILATNWGFEGSMDAFCAKAKKDGYDGIEQWWPDSEKEQAEMFAAVKKHGLDIAFCCGVGQPEPKEHFAQFKKYVTDAATQQIQRPLYINNHSGRDYYSAADCRPFFELTDALSKSTGIPIYHETHRGRILYAAHVARQYIETTPHLRLTLDISHWCNVHESLLDDQAETVALALERTEHIHARIGFEEGPQVNDPRAPEWDYAVQKHLQWWDAVVARKKKLGQPMTFLAEFGPPMYLPTLPYTLQPVANQWDINVHMMQLLRKRYS